MNVRSSRARLALILKVVVLASAGHAIADPVSSVVLLRSTPNPVVQGQNATIIAGVNPTGIAYPTGAITLTDVCSSANGSVTTSLGSFRLSPAGDGSLTVSSFPCVGSNQMIATYTGDANYLPGASAPLIETVLNQFTPTTTSLASSINPVPSAQPVTFTVELTYSFTDNSNATGVVSFTDVNTGAVLGTGTVETVGAARHEVTLATLMISLPPGTYAVQAAYSGDNIYSFSTSAVLNEVVQGSTTSTTTTSLKASLTSVNLGQPDTFTADVSANAGTPAGSVTFYDGSSVLGSLNLDSNGRAVLTDSSLSIGHHSVTATYSGDVNLSGSASTPVTITVNPSPAAATVTVLNSSSDPSVAGTSIALVAKISSSASGTPTGTVTFLNDSTTPATTLGTAAIQNGVAGIDLVFAAGTYSLSARYGGDASFDASTGVLTQVVNAPALSATTTTISSSGNPSSYGQSVTFVAAVKAHSGVPSGRVLFTAAGTSTAAMLDREGKAVFTTSAFPAGITSLSAAYAGNNENAGSTSPILDQTVTEATTETALTSSANPVGAGLAVKLTAKVTVKPPGSGIPTGVVSFVTDGSRVLCQSSAVEADGTATCSIGSLAVGPHTVAASYKGADNFSGSAASLTETVRAGGNIQLLTTGTGFVYSRATQLFSSTLTATNTNAQSVGAAIRAVFMDLPPGVRLANAAGTFNGAPYLTVPGSLGVGQSASFPAQFSDPTLADISYTIYYYSGVF